MGLITCQTCVCLGSSIAKTRDIGFGNLSDPYLFGLGAQLNPRILGLTAWQIICAWAQHVAESKDVGYGRLRDSCGLALCGTQKYWVWKQVGLMSSKPPILSSTGMLCYHLIFGSFKHGFRLKIKFLKYIDSLDNYGESKKILKKACQVDYYGTTLGTGWILKGYLRVW